MLWQPSGRLSISERAPKIQEAYCERAGEYVDGHPELPGWCGQAVELWLETLRLLRYDPLALCDRLDPYIKLAVFDAALSSAGRKWSDVASDPAL